MLYYDTETCGFHGPTILIQYAEDDGPIHLHEVWRTPAGETISLIERMMSHEGGLCGFNLAFDHFHLCQTYTTLLLMDPEDYPDEHIQKYAEMEYVARDGPCLKPVTAFDIMLHARKGPYQSLMARSDIRIKKIPTVLAFALAKELEERVALSDIYFAKRRNKYEPKWKVYDREDEDGNPEPDFKDIVLKFNASSALKVLATDALKLPPDTTLLFADVNVDAAFMPEEEGYAPYAMAHWKHGKWNGAWPDVIHQHIRHWAYDSLAREYAAKDVEYTRGLYRYFGSPEPGDDDSVLACMVGAVRWRGYSIDTEGMRELRREAILRQGKFPTAPEQVRRYVYQHMSPEEKLVLKDSTKKTLLEEIAAYERIECPSCGGIGEIATDRWLPGADNPIGEECPQCKGAQRIDHPAANAAAEVLDARKAGKEVELYDKLLFAGRFHASFVVIGTLSSRMAGDNGLNAQGVKKTKTVRSKFTLVHPGCILCGGDFSGFEVVLADAVYNDPALRQDLLSGKKIHALFGQFVYPGMSYEDILASDGTEDDKYTRAKSAVFAMFYGGEGYTLKDRLGVPIEDANAAYEKFCRRYPGVGRARQRMIDWFQTLRQTGGIGSRIEYKPAADFVESIFGFRRYFTLENMIVDALVQLAQNPPKSWKMNLKVVRRDRPQYVQGAVQSALYAAAFGMQAANMRAAANHEIQSSGATITKMVQRRIWELQPTGANEWLVQPFNVHDEIMCVTAPALIDRVADVVNQAVESVRPKVPLIKLSWNKNLSSWADKGK
jgi:hypothetical protein